MPFDCDNWSLRGRFQSFLLVLVTHRSGTPALPEAAWQVERGLVPARHQKSRWRKRRPQLQL
jgi:hypothetical protein